MTGTMAVLNEFKMTEVGPLPNDWEVVRLGDVSKVTSGGSAPQGKEFFNGQNPFVRVQHLELESDTIRRWDLITDEAVNKNSLKLYPRGTIVFPKSGASIYLEKRAILPIDAYIVSHLCAVTSESPLVDQGFLFYYLRFLRLSEQKAEGYPTLNLTEIKNTKVVCPPLPEQKRIAAVLCAVQEAKEKTEAVIQATRQLKKSLMKHLFTYGPVPLEEAGSVPLKETEIGLVPGGWEVVKFGKIIAKGPQNGIYKHQRFYGDGTCILRIDDYGNEGDIVIRARSKVQLTTEELGRYRLNTSDILINRVNSLTHLGKVALVGELSELVVFESNMMRLQVDQSLASPEYVLRFLSLPSSRDQMRGKAKRAVAQSSINQGDVKSLAFVLPPLPIQKRIVDILSSVDRKIEVEENKKKALEELFKTLLSNLMTGRIRVDRLEVEA